MIPLIDKIETPQDATVNLTEIMLQSRINIDEELPPPPVALSIGTYIYKGNPYYTPFGTYGNFSCLVGASKSMKTFLKSALIAGYIGGAAQNFFPDVRGHATEGKVILDFDTEQSKWHTQRVARRVIEMVGAPYDNYKAFFLREQDAKIRFQLIEHMVCEVYPGKVGLVAIDGAADVMENVNDLDEANKIVQGMMRWTSKTNCHVLTVLHRNHGTDKPTGHLGSAIMKKAETVAFVERDGDSTRVTANFTRNYPFQDFSFRLNADHLPEVENGFM